MAEGSPNSKPPAPIWCGGKLQNDIKRFLEVYQVLSADGKAHFEAQMAGSLKNVDERTKNLYYALLKAAKLGAGVEEALAEMQKTSQSQA